jgi:AcrR family transcriptional regulator
MVAGQKRATRRRLGADAARALIMEAAAKVFAQRGFYGATIDEIASEAGYSPAAIYKYFTNKEELFSLLWNTMAEKLRSIFTESNLIELPFHLRMRWLLSKLGQILETNPDMIIAFIAQRPYASRGVQTGLERRAYEYYRAHVNQLKVLMEQGIREGVLRQDDPEDFANLFIGLSYEFCYKWVTSEDEYDVSHNIDCVMDLFMRGAGSGAALQFDESRTRERRTAPGGRLKVEKREPSP